jgi:hypothetical protein
VNWFGWRKKSEAAPLQPPLPGQRRRKTWSAASGYVYLYTYLGSRANTEHVFAVGTESHPEMELRVVLTVAALQEVSAAADRGFNAAELYALAKLSFFAALDEAAEPPALSGLVLQPSVEQLLDFMKQLKLIESAEA